jgi:nitroimidazol reductase NimA-like FMN-containing flavoprotein (pyridoxamine 5'-phosphate oxidase superfamily)
MRALDRHEAESLLAKHHTGHMAFAFHDRITIQLVNYVYADGWLYSRLEPGATMTTLLHQQWVAFQVDEVEDVYDWRAVTVHGSVQFLDNDRSSPAWRDFNHAAELIRRQVPSVLTAHDPLPERVQLYRIHVDELIGRASESTERAHLPK